MKRRSKRIDPKIKTNQILYDGYDDYLKYNASSTQRVKYDDCFGSLKSSYLLLLIQALEDILPKLLSDKVDFGGKEW